LAPERLKSQVYPLSRELAPIHDLHCGQGAESIVVATEDTFLFMHDNAPCHTATKIQTILEKNDA
jgi:hypothetical protein